MTAFKAIDWKTVLGKSAPALLKQVTGLEETIVTDGALSAKTKVLMMMLCDALLAHPEGVANIANRARSMGASENEIIETLAIAFLMGGMPGLVIGANAFKE